MKPCRYILRFCGDGPKPAGDVRRIQSVAGLKVLDNASRRMMLVEAPPEVLGRLVGSLEKWVMSEEQMVPLPDVCKKISPQH